MQKLRRDKKQWARGRLLMLRKKAPCGPCRIGETSKAPSRRKRQHVASVIQKVPMPDNICTSHLPFLWREQKQPLDNKEQRRHHHAQLQVYEVLR